MTVGEEIWMGRENAAKTLKVSQASKTTSRKKENVIPRRSQCHCHGPYTSPNNAKYTFGLFQIYTFHGDE